MQVKHLRKKPDAGSTGTVHVKARNPRKAVVVDPPQLPTDAGTCKAELIAGEQLLFIEQLLSVWAPDAHPRRNQLA
jgi:hypothetical protein